jgi:hypothetical protein
MHKLLLFSALLLPVTAQAQGGGMVQATKDRINFSGLAVPTTGSYFGVKGDAGSLIGNQYLDTTFQAANVQFYQPIATIVGPSQERQPVRDLQGIAIRYDIAANEIELLVKSMTATPAPVNDAQQAARLGSGTSGRLGLSPLPGLPLAMIDKQGIRVANGMIVKGFEVNTPASGVSRFVNVREFDAPSNGPLTGFYEQIANGKLTLLRHTAITVRRANYNAALNTGSRDDEIVKESRWFVARGKAVTPFSPGRKALLTQMADHKEQLEAFLKDKKPDLRTKDGLAEVVEFYNGL